MSNCCEPFPLYCDLCQKSFSGPTPSKQHFRSEDHLRRERHGGSVSASAFDCGVCHAPCNSSRQRAEHNASPAHLERVKRQQQQSGCTPRSNLPVSRASKPYDFDGVRGMCYICEIELTSPQHAQQHLNGTKHKKKESQNTGEIGSSGPGPLFCSVCSVPFSSEGNAREHYRSAKHIKKEQELHGQYSQNTGNSIYQGPTTVQQIVPGVSLINASPVPNNLPTPLLPLQRYSFGVPNQNNTGPNSHLSSSDNARVVEFNGQTGYCNACRVDLTSPQMKEQHMSGSRHEKSLKQWSGSNSSTEANLKCDGNFNCDECHVTFSGPAPMQQHFASEKHKKKSALPHTNFSVNEPIKVNTKFQMNPSHLFPTELFPSEENLFQNEDISGMPLNIPAETSTQNVSNPLGSSYFSNQDPSTISSQAQSDEDIFLKVDGGNIFGTATRQNKELIVANRSSNLDTCYSQASAVLNSMISDQNADIENDIRTKQPFTFAGDHGWCNICNIELLSIIHAHDHLTGNDHCLRVAQSQNAPTPSPQPEIDAGKIYSFDGNRGYCNVCHIDLTSKQHANQHLNGKPHQKASEQLAVNSSSLISTTSDNSLELNKQEYRFDGTQGFCNVCSIQLTSRKHAEQHLKGKNHAKAKVCWTSFDETQVRSVPKISSVVDDKPDYEFRGGRGVCYICDIELTSNAHADQHLKGKNHKKAVERKQQQKIGNVHPLFCDVCRVQCSGPESAEQHFNSAKHLQKASMSNGGISSSEFTNPLCGMSIRQSNMEPNINNVARSLFQTDVVSQVNTCSESSIVINTTSPMQTQPKSLVSRASTGILSNSSLSSLRPAPNNLSLCTENLQSSDENQLTSIESECGKTSNITTGHQNAINQKIVVPEITTSSPIPIKKTCDILPSSTDVYHSKSDDENIDLRSSNSTSGQARGGSRYTPLQNRNHHRGNTIQFNIDGDASVEEVQNLFDGMEISETNDFSESDKSDNLVSFRSDCIDFLLNSNLETAGHHGHGVSSNLASLTSFQSTPPTQDGSQPATTCPPGSTVVGTTPRKPKSNPYGPHFKRYCDICDRPMNSEDSYNAHIKGRDHQQKAANIRAPRRELPPVTKTLSEDEAYDQAYKLVKNGPRTYQVELFSKTMMSDRIVFLPTGTGKTLVAAMTVSCMLEANPRRPVLFLVDKVLLVLQQSKYLHEQFGKKMFNRASPIDPNGPLESRRLKIATLCSGIAPSDSTPLYQYDVIVAVAAYCFNLMLQQRIYWSDFSLVVFDEAHHCTKKHPFNWLLQNYHANASSANRPKVLGLTASPAGKETVEATFVMLKELLVNLGNAKVGIVEYETAKEQLKKYQSNAQLHIKFEPRTNEEEDFRRQLLVYLVSCYLKLNEISNIDKECAFMHQFKPRLARGTKEEQLLECAEELNDPDRIKLFMHVLGMIQPNGNSPALHVKANLDFLSNHTLIMLISLQDMDGMGIPCSMEELQPLLNSEYSGNFDKAELLGLNCDKLRETVKAWQNSAMVSSEFHADDEQRMSLVKQLLSSLQNGRYLNWQGKEKPMALVLVRERVLALRLSKFLQGIGFVRELGLKVTAVVGHGSGPADNGMRVKEQKRVLDGVNQKRYQIIVATSVAEEGVDIPECELVICLNLPGTVTGFVQMRGRARKKDSHFVIICSNQKEQEQMHNLLRREKNMMTAAEQCVAEERYEEYKHS